MIKKNEGQQKGYYLYLLAKLYQEGTLDVKKNLKKSIKYFEDASVLDSDSAQYELGVLYQNGNGVDNNILQSKNYYQLASQKNHAKALLALGRLYKNGAEGIPKNLHKAIEYLLLAWKVGNATAELELNEIALLNLHFSDEEINKTYLLYLASKGYNEYMYSFAAISEEDQQYERAFNYYSKAAANDYWLAYYKLAIFYQEGLYIPQSTRQAIIHHLKAANHGIQESAEILKAYDITKYLSSNNLDYLHYTADTGNSLSQYKLYMLYIKGKNVKKDIAKALIYCQKSALGRHTEAMYKLGMIYRNGDLTTKDYTTAFRWFRKAAYLGHSLSKYELAEMYANQLGTNLTQDKNIFWAIKWYLSAANDGIEKSLLKLNKYDLSKHVLDSDLEIIKYKANRGYKDDQYKLGMYYLNQLNDTNAIRWLKKSFRNGKSSASIELAEIYAKGKCQQDTNYALSYEWYREALKNNLKDERLEFGIAYTFFKSKQYQKFRNNISEESLDKTIKMIYNYMSLLNKLNINLDLKVYNALGRLHFLNKSYGQSILEYTNYITKSNFKEACKINLINSLYRRSLSFMAIQHYKSAITDIDYSILIMNECTKVSKELEGEIYHTKGDIALDMKNHSEACKAYLKAEELGQVLKRDIKNICNHNNK